MLQYDQNTKRAVIRNNTLQMTLNFADGILIEECSNLLTGDLQNPRRELFNLTFMGGQYSSRDFAVGEVLTCQDRVHQLLTVPLENEALGLSIRVHFLNDKKETISVIVQIRDRYIHGVPYELFLHSPFLAQLSMRGEGDRYYYPANAVESPDGTPLLKMMRESFYNNDVKLPLVCCDKGGKSGFAVQFPSKADLDDCGAIQNRNMQFSKIASAEELHTHQILCNPDNTYNDTFEFEITGLSGGWVEAFARFRQQWESGYDFSEYEKEDLKWFNEKFLHQFSFLYGTEAYDAENQKIDPEKLLKEGEAFGGFDTVTLWNQYPRLGVDKRSQWDFYNDFPGGMAAFKEAVDAFHAKGVQVFMPYIPWDAGAEESPETLGDHFAGLLEQTGADGYQLDTLGDIPDSFREKCDAVRPGLVMTTQHHPDKKHPIEKITTSWDEFWDTRPMPKVDIFRFLCPRHIAPVISRWYRKEDKDLLIQYSQFGAAPLVIWQDIFGRWMPFSAEQKAAIKGWKEVYLAHRLTYQCALPTPFYPVAPREVYCNLFPADSGSEQIYSLYNDGDLPFEGALCELFVPGSKAEVILGGGEASVKNGKLYAQLPPKEVVHISVKP